MNRIFSFLKQKLWKQKLGRQKLGVLLVFTLFAALLAGCEPDPIPEAATSTPEPPAASSTLPTSTPRAGEAANESSSESPSESPAESSPSVAQPADPLPVDEALSPAQLSIPAIGLNAPVVAMGWWVSEVAGKRTTVWDLPDDALGWHPNSAGAGAAGNLVISGHQLLGEALLAPVALGEVALEQEILITDAEGQIFVYSISEVSEPLVISDDLAAEEQLGAELTSQSGTPRLTLVTGWPDFSSTHRVYVVADFVGVQP